MHINWYGQGTIGIKTKDLDIIIDPFDSTKSGLRLPKLKDRLVLASEFGSAKKFDKEGNTVIDSPGEYEFNEIFIYGKAIEGQYPKLVYSIHAEDIVLGHLGGISDAPEEEIINELSEVDVLFVPVGNHDYLSASKAAKLVTQIDPKVIIPIYHRVSGCKVDLDSVDKFSKEIGIKPEEEDKIILKKRDLTEDMQYIILNA